MLDVTVGTAPVNWNNRDVRDYRPWTPYAEMLDQMARAGYAGTEIGEEFPSDPEQIRLDLEARGLQPASTFCPVNLREERVQEREIERAEQVARFLAALGQDVILVADSGDGRRRSIAGHVGPEDGLDETGWRCLASGLQVLAERCAPLAVRIAFHNHVGTYVETEAELVRLLDMTDPELVGLCYDVGHMLYAGGEVMRVVDAYGPRVRYVHLKDVDMDVLARCRRESLGFHDALRLGIFTELGRGGLDFTRFFSALDALDYVGWIIVEQDTTGRTPFESALINRQYLRETFDL